MVRGRGTAELAQPVDGLLPRPGHPATGIDAPTARASPHALRQRHRRDHRRDEHHEYQRPYKRARSSDRPEPPVTTGAAGAGTGAGAVFDAPVSVGAVCTVVGAVPAAGGGGS